MANSLTSRAARACLAGTLAFSFDLAPAVAHMAGGHVGPVGAGLRHFPHPSQRGFSRYGQNHFIWSGQRGYGWNGRGRFGWNGQGRYGWNGYRWNDRGGAAWNNWRGYRWNGYRRNGQGQYGWSAFPSAWGADSLGAWGGASGPAPSAPAVVLAGEAPPVAINVISEPAAGHDDHYGGCVIHQLRYDSAGNYIGESQVSNC